MTTAPATAQRKQRRTQESRSANTRAKLLKATIDSLHQQGYAATTTLVVCEKAGVSRGAMLHQFPTRTDLMLFVVQAVYDEELHLYREKLRAIADPRERLLALSDVLWDVLGRPAGVAVLEIMQGARSDPEVAGQLKRLQMEIEKDSFRQVDELAAMAGARVPAEVKRLMVWAVRGLSIARLLTDNPSGIEESIRLLRQLLEANLENTTEN